MKWRGDGSPCHGKYVRDVCVLGLGDLAELPNRPELFVNKIKTNFERRAFSCLEEWHLEKVRQKRVDIRPEFYRNLEAVRFLNTGRCPKIGRRTEKKTSSDIEDFIRSRIVEYKWK